MMDAEMGCPIGEAHRFTVVREEASVALIPHLLFQTRPSAVLRCVGTVIVNPVKSETLRALTHIV